MYPNSKHLKADERHDPTASFIATAKGQHALLTAMMEMTKSYDSIRAHQARPRVAAIGNHASSPNLGLLQDPLLLSLALQRQYPPYSGYARHVMSPLEPQPRSDQSLFPAMTSLAFNQRGISSSDNISNNLFSTSGPQETMVDRSTQVCQIPSLNGAPFYEQVIRRQPDNARGQQRGSSSPQGLLLDDNKSNSTKVPPPHTGCETSLCHHTAVTGGVGGSSHRQEDNLDIKPSPVNKQALPELHHDFERGDCDGEHVDSSSHRPQFAANAGSSPSCWEDSQKPSESKPKRAPTLPIPLAIEEDPNWLSELHCFIRAELVEVFQASQEDVDSRRKTKAVSLGQVGIRCRYCAGCTEDVKQRAGRRATFPSSLRQIYQSMTMMIREHFKYCSAVPDELKRQLWRLQQHGSSGAQESKSYWEHSAKKLGMRDSKSSTGIVLVDDEEESGTVVDEKSEHFEGLYCIKTEQPSLEIPADMSKRASHCDSKNDLVDQLPILAERDDRRYTSEFVFTVMSQFVICSPPMMAATTALESREIMSGNVHRSRTSSSKENAARVGCKYCVKRDGGYGTAQMYIRRKCYLPDKVNRMCDHLKRCAACPPVWKDAVNCLSRATTHSVDYHDNKIFYDRVWAKLKPKVRKKSSDTRKFKKI